jgi:phage baseplate assembly protein W
MTSLVDFGTDIRCVDDIDPHLRLVSGAENVACALARRLRTKRGKLFYARDYGRDLTAYVNADLTTTAMHDLRKDVERECLKDERVTEAVARVSWDASASMIVVLVRAKGSGRDMRLVLGIDSVTVTVLEAA